MIDFHSHILPGIDDGSASVDESMELLRLARQQGIRRVIATPHFYAWRDDPEAFLRRRDAAELALRQVMLTRGGVAPVSVGAEVAYFRGIGESEAVEKLTIRGTEYLLVEMPAAPWTEAMYAELQQLCHRGFVPIIAHIDRYIRPFKTYGIPAKLEKLPVLVQANGEFFLQPDTVSMAMKMLKAGQIHLLGSDCHNLTDRKPNLGDAVEVIQRKLGRSALAPIREHQREVLGI